MTEYEGIRILRNSYSYVVTGGGTTYHTTLAAALKEMSERLFDRKLIERDSQGDKDLQSLLMLIASHNSEMKRLFLKFNIAKPDR